MNPLVVGIYGSSTQSGMAFTADLIDQRRVVYGYARPSDHGKEFVDAVTEQRGIYVQRPEGVSGESSKFVDINGLNDVGHDLERLVNTSDVIILSHPAIYQEESARLLRDSCGRTRCPAGTGKSQKNTSCSCSRKEFSRTLHVARAGRELSSSCIFNLSLFM